jgi:hypothetical protein
MNQQPISNRILAGVFTFLGLGVVWMVIIGNLPSQEELSARESIQPPSVAVAPHAVQEPVLDLSIPGVPQAPPVSEGVSSSARVSSQPAARPPDRRAVQVARLRCEAEVEQLCPQASDGSGRRQCLEKRAHQLSVRCQQQVRERLVRWKEERDRLMLACEADSRKFCSDVRPGGGQHLQCLQQHAQEVSDGCYALLPKGTVYFKQ